MGIQICSNKGTGHFWGPIRAKQGKHFINLQKSSSREPGTGRNTLMFSNKVPRVTYGPHPRGLNLQIVIYREMHKTFLFKNH